MFSTKGLISNNTEPEDQVFNRSLYSDNKVCHYVSRVTFTLVY